MPKIEEGVVVKKGIRWGNVFLTLLFAFALDAVEVTYYWAKIKISDRKKPFKIRSKYNLKKGTIVRIKYDENNLTKCELIID